MPTVEENSAYWDGCYSWHDGGAEWSRDWGTVTMQWYGTILPRIAPHLPSDTIVEVGCGYGRWTAFLKDQCRTLIAVDVSESCIGACRERFRDDPHVSLHQNDGRSLAMVAAGSADFVYSFDVLPMVDAPTIDAYLAEIARVLKAGGCAFLHHSNLGAHPLHERLRHLPVIGAALQKLRLVDTDLHWRDPGVDAGFVARRAARHGLTCRSQELFRWGTRHVYLDVFSVLMRSPAGQTEPSVFRNRHFDEDAKRQAELAKLYMPARR